MSAYNGIVTDLDEQTYHSHPSLSSTQARLLLESPAKYKWSLTHPQPHKDAFDLGTATHSKVLGVGAEAVVLDFADFRTKAAKEARDEARAAGQIVISAADMAKVDGMAEAVLAHPEARQVLESIEGREVSLFADFDSVPTRARFDIYGGNLAADLKSARDASPKGFNATVGRYGYHIQDRWYEEAHIEITGHSLDSFKFLVVENTAPYLVAVYELDYMWGDLAKERTERARELFRQCTATDTWPGYMGGTLTPPTWAIFDADREEEEIQV